MAAVARWDRVVAVAETADDDEADTTPTVIDVRVAVAVATRTAARDEVATVSFIAFARTLLSLGSQFGVGLLLIVYWMNQWLEGLEIWPLLGVIIY